MGGGKGSSSNSPQPPQQQYDTSAQEAALRAQMASFAALQQQSMMLAQQAAMRVTNAPLPEIPPAPDPIKSPVEDWAARRRELEDKIRADYATSKKPRKNRQSTIATSPLLDEEEPDTTNPNSLLTSLSTL